RLKMKSSRADCFGGTDDMTWIHAQTTTFYLSAGHCRGQPSLLASFWASCYLYLQPITFRATWGTVG
ncbi:MAG: hypothetical protein OEY80_02030, partial [Nitrospirota bacterium]|nr:hypothetical protein [Nitrospirota bacterium]